MKPLNQKERNNLFFQFLVFYVVSIIVVLFAAFGNIQMNSKQNEDLNATMNKLKKEMKASEDFYIQMRRVEGIITEVNTPEAKRNLDAKFQREKKALADLAYQQDSSRMERLGWYEIISGYDQRWEDKGNIADQKSLMSTIKEKNDEIDDWKEKYNKLDREYTKSIQTH